MNFLQQFGISFSLLFTQIAGFVILIGVLWFWVISRGNRRRPWK